MDPRVLRQLQRYGWDNAAACYEGCWQQRLRPGQDRLLEVAALDPGERVLDMACGTGLVSIAAAQAIGPEGELIGVDLSGAMLRVAAAKAKRLKLAHAHFVRMEAEALQLPDNTFDTALCALGLMHMVEPQRALAELHRVVKPDGRAVLLVWGVEKRSGWAGLPPLVQAHLTIDTCGEFFRLGERDALEAGLRDAGFEETESERQEVTLEFDSEDALCEAVFAGGSLARVWARSAQGTRAALARDFLASVEAHRSGAGYAIPCEFVIGVGRKAV